MSKFLYISCLRSFICNIKKIQRNIQMQPLKLITMDIGSRTTSLFSFASTLQFSYIYFISPQFSLLQFFVSSFILIWYQSEQSFASCKIFIPFVLLFFGILLGFSNISHNSPWPHIDSLSTAKPRPPHRHPQLLLIKSQRYDSTDISHAHNHCCFVAAVTPN